MTHEEVIDLCNSGALNCNNDGFLWEYKGHTHYKEPYR
jgi:hypothetical protein